jgi:hypothetical protein
MPLSEFATSLRYQKATHKREMTDDDNRDHDFTKVPVTNGLTPTSNRRNRSFLLEVIIILLVIGIVLYLI